MPDVLVLDGWEAIFDGNGIPVGIRWWGRTSFATAPISIPLHYESGGMVIDTIANGVGSNEADQDGNYFWSVSKTELPLETSIYIRDDTPTPPLTDQAYVYTIPTRYIGMVSPLLLRYIVDGFAGVIPAP